MANVHPLESAEDIEPVGAEIKDEARISAARGEPPLHETPQQGDAIATALKEASRQSKTSTISLST